MFKILGVVLSPNLAFILNWEEDTNIKTKSNYNYLYFRGHHGRDRMVVGFTTTCAISAYHHSSCEFEPRSWRGVLHMLGTARFGKGFSPVLVLLKN